MFLKEVKKKSLRRDRDHSICTCMEDHLFIQKLSCFLRGWGGKKRIEREYVYPLETLSIVRGGGVHPKLYGVFTRTDYGWVGYFQKEREHRFGVIFKHSWFFRYKKCEQTRGLWIKEEVSEDAVYREIRGLWERGIKK